MGLSFTPIRNAVAGENDKKLKVLVTGAAGNIGSYFAEHNHDRYTLRLMVREMDEDAKKLLSFGEGIKLGFGQFILKLLYFGFVL